ncbi:type III-B CRISPR module RAMP protein Cmr4 [Methanopyrus kandleri]|uniref:Predicted component of a thermophile-specific DNA repair system, contains a RAMP domain n=1 Tax=Methanopyrus kandleri (strain AV19 / DSM 6324 / JCM 9639 / NBRC 100938) TaxID=190192 RepID=Q8TVT9_METKA|nr:type III-B CRISPR module RAMP protein Cmr4 [Methanopyrus kandleri]AAM02512.1 Predicted component of a thermophile-specific DNA repair system, contains a RAMP domain [Methanopyrus kandleri AV19]
MTDALPYFLVCRTPTRAGAGQRATDVIDLPLQREAHTKLPVIYGSTLKGALRHATLRKLSEELDGETSEGLVDAVFGDRPGEGSPSPGVVAFSDAVLLAMPVRCEPGFLAWVTSPYQLGRLYEVLELTGELEDLREAVEEVLNDCKDPRGNGALAPEEGTLLLDRIRVRAEASDAVGDLAGVLSETVFEGAPEPHFRRYVEERLVVLGDGAFADLVNSCTERVVRVRLNEEKTVEQGPWYEERVPEGTVFFGTLNVRHDTVPPKNGVDARKVLFGRWEPDGVPDGDDRKLEALKEAAGELEAGVLGAVADGSGDGYLDLRFQVGGSETVGFGLVRLRQFVGE